MQLKDLELGLFGLLGGLGGSLFAVFLLWLDCFLSHKDSRV